MKVNIALKSEKSAVIAGIFMIFSHGKEAISCQLKHIILMEDVMKAKKGLHDEIARVAYELYEKRDRTHGHDLADWFTAEKIVMEKHARHAKETGQEVGIIKKGKHGFPKTVKKEGYGHRG